MFLQTAATNPTPSELGCGDGGETSGEGEGGGEGPPLVLAARPGKAGYNAFFSPAYLEPPLERSQTVLARGGDVLIQVAEQGEKQSEANDLGVAVALVLLSACPAVLFLRSNNRVLLMTRACFSGSTSPHVLGQCRAADPK